MKSSVLLALLVLYGGVVEAQNEIWTIPKPKPVEGAEEYKQGEAAFKAKDWNGAISAFEAAVSKNPDLFACHYYLGWAYKSTNNPGKSAGNFVKFLNKAPKDDSAAQMVAAATREAGVGHARTKKYSEALPFLSKAAAANSKDTEVLYYMGIAQMQTGDDASAEQTFDNVLRLQPNLDRAHYYAGVLDYKADRFEPAKEHLEKYLELKPDGPFAADAQTMLDDIATRTQPQDPQQ
jgi:tetratricopeptide (TPR) repeat protein